MKEKVLTEPTADEIASAVANHRQAAWEWLNDHFDMSAFGVCDWCDAIAEIVTNTSENCRGEEGMGCCEDCVEGDLQGMWLL